jgi:hypothetical protein
MKIKAMHANLSISLTTDTVSMLLAAAASIKWHCRALSAVTAWAWLLLTQQQW